MLVVWDGSSWVPVAEDDVAILEEIILKDQATDVEIVLSVRDGALIVTNPFLETVSEIDLGGTTPDPGNMAKVSSMAVVVTPQALTPTKQTTMAC